MNKVKRFFIVTLFHFVAYNALCQAEQKQLFFKDPRAGSFTIFGDIPVSHTTGVPDISIPLFTLESHGYKIPVTLKYHLALVKPPYDYTNVATGWVLEAGGTITQEFKTQDDLLGMQPSVLRTDLSPWAVDYNERFYIDQVYNKGYDCEHDVFNYSFAGKNGKFIIDKTSTQGQWSIKPLTPTHIKGGINTTYYPNIPTYASPNIQITDDQGYEYIFQDAEAKPLSGSNTFFLNEVRSPNGNILFDFDYEQFAGTGLCFALQNVSVSDAKSFAIYYMQNTCLTPGQCTADPYHSILNPQTRIFKDPGKNIKRIVFATGSLEFQLTSDNRYIEGLTLKDINNNIIKTVTFDIGTFPGQGYRYLDKVHIRDGQQNTVETYAMTYNESYVAVNNNTLAVDYWGYLCSNAQSQPGGYVPIRNFTFPLISGYCVQPGTPFEYMQHSPEQNYPIGDGSRAPNAMAFVYTLNAIQYPTGGKTVFAYELNGEPGNQVGGLRIRDITNYSTPNDIAWKKHYEYEQSEIDFPVDNDYETTTYNYNFVFIGGGCYYATVERNRYYSYKKTPAVSDNRARYGQVTEYWQNGSEDNGKTVYNYSFPYLNTFEVADNNYFIREQTEHITGPSLNKKTLYKKVNTTYSKLREEIYEYDFLETDRIKNLIINSTNIYMGGAGTGIGFYLFDTYGPPNVWNRPGFNFFYYDIVAGAYQLTQKTVKEYSGSDLMTTVNTYQYTDGLDKYPTGETITTSDGATKATNYKYVYSSGYATLFPNSQMIDKNIIADPIEIKTETIKGGIARPVTLVRNTYNQFGPGIFRPETVQVAQGSGSLETRFRYDYESDFGNLISSSKENNVKEVYLWGYNKTLPVAKATNAQANEIFFNSFEEGGWDNNLTSYDRSKSHSGKFSGRIDNPTSGEIVSMSTNWLNISLSSPTKFKYSGWVYSTGPSAEIFLFMKTASEQGYFTHVANIVSYTTNKWTFIEGEYTVPANITQLNIRVDDNGGGTVWFDDIRLHPSSAQMTTYTYEPLVGMTSQTDINNNTTYFEYDGFGRLMLVRDRDKNILKKICYNYAGQPENCSVYYNSAASGNFTKSCGTGYIGSTVTYNVPAGVYNASSQSAADQLAQNDVNSNGQAYANANGTCTPVYYSDDYSGYYYSQNCIFPQTPQPYYISMPYGTFSSTVSLQDANNQAYQYAQDYANINGSCQSSVMLTYNNSSPSSNLYVILTDVNTYQQTYFSITSNWSGFLGSVPAGTYHIEVGDYNWNYNYYNVGCGYYSYGYSATFFNVTVNDYCNTISIY